MSRTNPLMHYAETKEMGGKNKAPPALWTGDKRPAHILSQIKRQEP